MVAIVDYDAGNLASVVRALEYVGAECLITREEQAILQADHLILPGVGSFGDAMEKLHRYGLVEPIRRFVDSGKPFLGICLGLQLMFESSEETPGVQGLGILPGKVIQIPHETGLKIPHIGWNSLHFPQKADSGMGGSSRLFAGLPQDSYVYFVHSYYLQAERAEDVAAVTEYGVSIHAAVERGNICACQFHPEKSGDIGLQILRNFIQM